MSIDVLGCSQDVLSSFSGYLKDTMVGLVGLVGFVGLLSLVSLMGLVGLVGLLGLVGPASVIGWVSLGAK